MTATDWIQALAMVVLVIVTGIYAWRTVVISRSTGRQADASAKMAEEMKNQRYDMVRPVIDIQWEPDTHGEIKLMNNAGQIAIAKGQTPQLPDKLTCRLCNVGIGPATDVYSYIQSGTEPDYECHQLRSFGLLRVKGDLGPRPLSLKEIENRKFLIVYYRDIHNRCFQSIREVSRDEKRGNLKLDPLGTSKLAKEVYRELNVGNYTGFLEKLWSSSTAGGK
jgi:hypothetical protein